MNVFVLIMVFFAALGLLDVIIGGKMGLAKEFERGLTTMGGLCLSVVGFYAICVSFVQAHAEAISARTAFLPFDPSLIIGSILAPDMGALGMAFSLAATPALAVFTGALVGGSLGMTVGYQLPVFLGTVKKDEIPALMQGFIYGLIALPPGLIVGGFMLGLNVKTLALNLIPTMLLCLLLIVCFLKLPRGTMKVLTVFGNIIRIASYIFFVMAVIGVFAPSLAIADSSYVKDILFMILRMVLVACGGMVLSHIVLTKSPKQIRKLADLLGVNNESVMGLILSFTQSLAMLPLFSRMDRKGQILNAAFSVAGAYVVGGQFAFVSSLVGGSEALAYVVCKLISGIAAVVIAAIFADRR